jgi:hypothetical protein
MRLSLAWIETCLSASDGATTTLSAANHVLAGIKLGTAGQVYRTNNSIIFIHCLALLRRKFAAGDPPAWQQSAHGGSGQNVGMPALTGMHLQYSGSSRSLPVQPGFRIQAHLFASYAHGHMQSCRNIVAMCGATVCTCTIHSATNRSPAGSANKNQLCMRLNGTSVKCIVISCTGVNAGREVHLVQVCAHGCSGCLAALLEGVHTEA